MSTLAGLKILFADDEIWEMRPTIDALEKQGASVEIAKDGTEVLGYLRAHRDDPPDLVILDIMMPEGAEIDTTDEGRSTGVQVYRKVRDVLRLQVPVVVSTVVTDEQILEPVRKGRNVAIIKKPYRFDELLRVISEVLPGVGR